MQPSSTAPQRRGWLGPSLTRPRVFTSSKFARISLRLLVWGGVLSAGLVVILLMAVNVAATPTRIKKVLIALAAEQTGGSLEVGQVEFGLFTGIRLHEVSLYPPLAGDTRGSLNDGAVATVPLIQAKLIRFEYSTRQLLAGYIHLRGLQLIEPTLLLRKEDGRFNFESILAYRAEHFPKKAEALPPAKEPPADKKGTALLPLDPSTLSLPIRLLVENVGIKDLTVKMDVAADAKNAAVAQQTLIQGLSIDLGMHWHGRKSSIWVSSLSPYGKALKIKVQKATVLGGDLKKALTVEAPLSFRLEVQNLKFLNIDLATRLLELFTPAASYKDLLTNFTVRVALADDLKGIKIDGVNLELADALAYELAGAIGIADASFSAFNLQLRQKLELDLAAAAMLARPFVPGLRAQGEISLEDFHVDGTVEPATVAKAAAEGVGLPMVALKLGLHDVAGGLPSLALDMAPINGEVSFAVGPSAASKGSQIDVAVDIRAPKILTQRNTPVGEIKAGMYGFTTKVIARALWPEKVAPVFKLNIEADRVVASGAHIAPVDVPLSIDVDAQGRQDLSQFAVAARAELKGLTNFAAMIDCQNFCNHLLSSVEAHVESLAKVHAIALPLADIMNLGPFMPTQLAGKIDYKGSARGKLPNPLKTPTTELIKQADIHFDSNLEIAQVSVKVPFDQLQLTGAETRLHVSGSLKDQTVDFRQKFNGLKLAHAKPEAPVMPISVRQFALETNIKNHIEGPLDISEVPALLQRLRTDVETKLVVGQVAVDGALPRPITDFQFNAALRQEGLSAFKLKDLRVQVSDMGATVGLKGSTTVDKDYLPQRLDLTLTSQMSHGGGEGLPGGIKTSGKAAFDLALSSEDMRDLSVHGQARFDHFNVTIPGKDIGQRPTLVVEDIDGEIPFKQTLRLPDLKKMKQSSLAKAEPLKTDVAVHADQKNATAIPTVPVIEVSEASADANGRSNAGAQSLDRSMDQFLKKNDNKLPVDTNIVAMVDYSSIRPFYPDRRPLSIKRVDVANLELTNLEFDMELRQSFFSLNQFLIDFLGGKIEGDFKLSFDTTAAEPTKIPKKIWTSLHLTRLDTRKLIERFPNLKGKGSTWDLLSNPYIDATVHILFDVGSSDISGNIEISSIGKEQLKMMLFYVDPYEQNPTIADIRSALNLGEVRRVSIPLRNGEVGIDVDVRVLSAPIPTPKLTRFPIRQILQNFKDQSNKDQSKAG